MNFACWGKSLGGIYQKCNLKMLENKHLISLLIVDQKPRNFAQFTADDIDKFKDLAKQKLEEQDALPMELDDMYRYKILEIQPVPDIMPKEHIDFVRKLNKNISEIIYRYAEKIQQLYAFDPEINWPVLFKNRENTRLDVFIYNAALLLSEYGYNVQQAYMTMEQRSAILDNARDLYYIYKAYPNQNWISKLLQVKTAQIDTIIRGMFSTIPCNDKDRQWFDFFQAISIIKPTMSFTCWGKSLGEIYQECNLKMLENKYLISLLFVDQKPRNFTQFTADDMLKFQRLVEQALKQQNTILAESIKIQTTDQTIFADPENMVAKNMLILQQIQNADAWQKTFEMLGSDKASIIIKNASQVQQLYTLDAKLGKEDWHKVLNKINTESLEEFIRNAITLQSIEPKLAINWQGLIRMESDLQYKKTMLSIKHATTLQQLYQLNPKVAWIEQLMELADQKSFDGKYIDAMLKLAQQKNMSWVEQISQMTSDPRTGPYNSSNKLYTINCMAEIMHTDIDVIADRDWFNLFENLENDSESYDWQQFIRMYKKYELKNLCNEFLQLLLVTDNAGPEDFYNIDDDSFKQRIAKLATLQQEYLLCTNKELGKHEPQPVLKKTLDAMKEYGLSIYDVSCEDFVSYVSSIMQEIDTVQDTISITRK